MNGLIAQSFLMCHCLCAWLPSLSELPLLPLFIQPPVAALSFFLLPSPLIPLLIVIMPTLTPTFPRPNFPRVLSALDRSVPSGPLQYRWKRPDETISPTDTKPLNQEQHRLHVLRLYRKIVRSVPRVLMAYEITGGPQLERDAVYNVRQHFEHNRHIKDPGVQGVLRHKTEMEISETLQMWKTKSHVCNLVLNMPSAPVAQLMAKQQQAKNLPKEAQQSPFLTSFYQG